MGWRYYRRIRIAPGFTLNLSKRGMSVSAGICGAHITAGTRGSRETVGLPGTGISYTEHQGRRRRRPKAHHTIGGLLIVLIVLYLVGRAFGGG